MLELIGLYVSKWQQSVLYRVAVVNPSENVIFSETSSAPSSVLLSIHPEPPLLSARRQKYPLPA